MAENFKDVVKKLGSAVKKPSAAKTPTVLAVQIVDKAGKVIKEDKGAAASEKAREEKATQRKQTTLFEQMADSLKALHKSFLASVKETGKMGLGIIIAAIAAPIIVLVAFFKQLAAEFMFLKKLTGAGLTKLFAPLKALFTGTGPVGEAFAGLAKTIDSIKDTIKTSKGFKAIESVGKTIKSTIASLTKFMKPATDFFKTVFNLGDDLVKSTKIAQGIKTFATKFGTILGKIFLPITILMSAFDFITGFMEGYEEEGILGGLEGGLTKLFQGLIGMPLDLLKSAVSWILGVFGWNSAEKWLDSFSFSTLIGDMIRGMFDMIGKVVDWIKLLFTDPVAALSKLWDTLTGGYASIMDFLWAPVKAGIAWVMKLFGWDEAAAATESFSISGYINGIFATIKEWFTDLFSWGAEKGETAAGGFSLGLMLGGVITTVKDWFVGLFEWGAEAGKDKEGKWSLSTMVLTVFGKVKTWFTNLFSWASTEDDKDSWVVSTIKDVVDTVKTWLGNMFKFDSASSILATAFNIVTFLPNIIFKGLTLVSKWLLGLFGFDDAAEKVANADNWTIGSMIVGAFKAVKDWVIGLFTWGKEKGETAAGGFSLWKMITGIFTSVKDWFFGIFGFGTDEEGKDKPIQVKEAEGFSLAKILGDTIRKVWDWFKDLLDIDLMSIAKKIPGYDTFMSIFGSNDKTPEELKAEQAKTAAGKKKAQKIENVDPGPLAAGGPIRAGQWGLVGEMGPELILPNQGGQVLNAQRTQQILQAGMQRDMGGGAGGGITSINTGGNIVSAPTTNYVNNGIAARRPIILAA